MKQNGVAESIVSFHFTIHFQKFHSLFVLIDFHRIPKFSLLLLLFFLSLCFRKEYIGFARELNFELQTCISLWINSCFGFCMRFSLVVFFLSFILWFLCILPFHLIFVFFLSRLLSTKNKNKNNVNSLNVIPGTEENSKDKY